MEGGSGSVVFSSGMAAISSVLLANLSPGDHVVAASPLYSGTKSFLRNFCTRMNIQQTYVDGPDISQYKDAIKPNTKILYGETPGNPKMTVMDLERFGKLKDDNPNLILVVDATFGTPALVQPINFGIDYVVHSCTKYMGGHGDLVAGCATARTYELWYKVKYFQLTLGNQLPPFDSFLLQRGLQTLVIRMKKHSDNAKKIGQFLEAHEKIENVACCELPSHPEHNIIAKQMIRGGGMIALEVKGGYQAAKKLVESTKLINLAVSLGTVQSLMEHGASMVHGDWAYSEEERQAEKITPGLIRFSVGLENADDIICDLEKALDLI